MKLRSALMMALKDHIAREGLSQSHAARLFGVTQPRISDLMRGKVDLFSPDTMAAAGPNSQTERGDRLFRSLVSNEELRHVLVILKAEGVPLRCPEASC